MSDTAPQTTRKTSPPAPQSAPTVRFVYIATVVLLTAGGLALAWLLIDPAPPDRIRLATGTAGGFYDNLGDRFAWNLRGHGLDVELVETAGSVENLSLLEGEDPVDAAFIQGGVGYPPPESTPLRSLASLAIEPFWVFSRSEGNLTDLFSRPGLRLAAGGEGSGTRVLVEDVLQLMGYTNTVTLLEIGGKEAADALLADQVDAVATVTAAQSPWVEELLRAPGVKIVDAEHVDAIARRFPFAYRVDLPARVFDFRASIPNRDIAALGVATNLVVREELHPAIKQVLLQASSDVARGSRILGTVGQFPSRDYGEFPLDSEAERYFNFGPSPMRRYLPFWAANLLERFWVLIIPIATLIVPILRFGPSTVTWGIRRRIYRHYKELRELEAAAQEANSDEERAKVLEALDKVEEQIKEVVVPLAFRDDHYRLRTHVVFVREQVSAPPEDTEAQTETATRTAIR